MKSILTDTFGDDPIRFITAPIRAQTHKRNASPLLAFPLWGLPSPRLYDSPADNSQFGQYTKGSFTRAIVVFGIGVVSLFLVLNAVAGLPTERLLRPVRQGAER